MNRSKLPQPPDLAAQTLQMLQDEDTWPMWPLLPVKRERTDGSFPECATVAAGDPARVYHCTMFDFRTETYTDYSGPAAVVQDGWRVD